MILQQNKIVKIQIEIYYFWLNIRKIKVNMVLFMIIVGILFYLPLICANLNDYSRLLIAYSSFEQIFLWNHFTCFDKRKYNHNNMNQNLFKKKKLIKSLSQMKTVKS